MSSISSFGRRSSIDDRHSSISSAGNMDTINEQSIVDQFQLRPIVTELDDHGICGIAPLHNKRQRRGSFVGFSDDHDQRNRCDIPDLGPNKRKDLVSAPSVGGFNLATAITERKELPRGLNPFDFKRFQNKDHGLTYQYSSSESDLTTTDQLKHNNMSILLEKTEYKNDSERRPKSGDRSIERRESASGLSGNENPYMIVRCTFGSAGQAVLIDVDTTKAKQKQHKESQRRKRKECFWKMITLLFFLGTCAIFPYAVVQHVKYINKSKLSEKDVINGGNTIQSRSNKPAVTTLVSMNISREQVTLPPKTTILLTTRSAESTSPGNSTKAPLLSFYSSIFLVPKWDCGHRLVINLSRLNTYLVVQHFKMETRPPLWQCNKETDLCMLVKMHYCRQKHCATSQGLDVRDSSSMGQHWTHGYLQWKLWQGTESVQRPAYVTYGKNPKP